MQEFEVAWLTVHVRLQRLIDFHRFNDVGRNSAPAGLHPPFDSLDRNLWRMKPKEKQSDVPACHFAPP